MSDDAKQSSGVGIRFVRQYDIQTAQRVSRLDVLYGIPEIPPAFWYWPWLSYMWRTKVKWWWEFRRPTWMGRRPLRHAPEQWTDEERDAYRGMNEL